MCAGCFCLHHEKQMLMSREVVEAWRKENANLKTELHNSLAALDRAHTDNERLRAELEIAKAAPKDAKEDGRGV